MQYQPLHCWDCGVKIIDGAHGRYTAMPALRQVKFALSGGAYSEHPFCQTCAERTWTPDRIAAFKQAVDVIAPHYRAYQITGVEGSAPLTSPIVGIV